MPLSNESHFGVVPMTEAINKLPATTTILRSLGLFAPLPITTTSVRIEERDGTLSLVPNVPRGSQGQSVAPKPRQVHSFEVTHLPKQDVVMADDVQNVRAFGTQNKAETVAELVNDKLQDQKGDLEYTREHLMLGAIKGRLLDADGSVIVDLYDRFKVKPTKFDIKLSDDKTLVGQDMDTIKRALRKHLKGESLNGYYVLCGQEFYSDLIHHASIRKLYEFYKTNTFVDKQTHESFSHQGVTYVCYDHEFASGEKLADNEAKLVPKGTRKMFKEAFAPANMTKTVNTKGKPYYASREKL